MLQCAVICLIYILCMFPYFATCLVDKYLEGYSNCEFPRYSSVEWSANYGRKLPNHPAVFYDIDSLYSWPDEFAEKTGFQQKYGHTTFHTLPEYLAAGGLLWWFNMMKVDNRPYWKSYSYNTLLKNSAEYPIYMQDFVCVTPVCQAVFREDIISRIAHFFGDAVAPEGIVAYAHVGSTGSGLPFHTHEHFWQGLAAGKKVWYAVPPNAMTSSLHDLIGPHTFPTRAFADKAFNTLPIGDRPLICVQKPGEVFYMPNMWWHATLNLDDFNLSFGSKLTKESQGISWSAASDAETNYTGLSVTYPFVFDTGCTSEKRCDGNEKGHRRELIPDQDLPFTLKSTLDSFEEKMTKGNDADAWRVIDRLERSLSRAVNRSWLYALDLHDGDRESDAGAVATAALSDPVAVVYCLMARSVLSALPAMSPDESTARILRSASWARKAQDLSPAVQELACGPAHKLLQSSQKEKKKRSKVGRKVQSEGKQIEL